MNFEMAEMKREIAALKREVEKMENNLREANIILEMLAPGKEYRAFDMTGCEIPDDGEMFRCGWDVGRLVKVHVDRKTGTIWGLMEVDAIYVEREEE